MSGESRKLTTILAADVVGYSRLAAADEERTLARLRALRSDLIDPAISLHHGRVVKRTGDGILIEFRSVVDAVRCAIEVQNGTVERNAGLPPERQIQFRVGLHLGDVVEEADGDLMGDGVNIAARLENICEPGAICLSEDAYRQVRSRLDLSVADLGDKELKNIPEPVHVFSLEVGKPAQAKLRGRAKRARRGALVPILAAVAVLALIVGVGAWYLFMRAGTNLAANQPAHLSIVVLPFANLSNDPKQDYFADGITDNLTTDLSRIRGSFVIARNTAFTYKGKNVDAKEIGKELDVRYVLEGSVQRDGNRVRVNAQLIDAESGAHLWADRFEEELSDLFKLQDDVVARLANTLGYELVNAEARRAGHSKNPDAIDLTMQGWAFLLENAGTDKAASEATNKMFERALTLDPNDDSALVGIAFFQTRAFIFGWGDSSINHDSKVIAPADRAIAINSDNARAYYVKCIYLAESKRPGDALVVATAGLIHDPNSAALYFARALAEVAVGRYDPARSDLAQAMKLSPRDPQMGMWHSLLGGVEIAVGNDNAAIEEEQKGLEAGYRVYLPHAELASAYALSGKQQDAKSELAEALRINPKLTIKWAMAHTIDAPRFYDGLRKAGLPEDEPPKHLSIVVLPFTNLSGDANQDYFADGITENLTTDLSRSIHDAFVIARNTAFTFKGKNVDAKEIGRELSVHYVLEGSVQRDGHQVRVNAQLIDAETGSHLWADRFDDNLADLFKLQDEIVSRLAWALQIELVTAESQRSLRDRPQNPDAIDLTMRGWALVWQQPNRDRYARARALFEQALKLDLNSADALAGVAMTYMRGYTYGWEVTSGDYDANVLVPADRAIALNPANAMAYYAKGVYLAQTKRPNDALAVAEIGLGNIPNFAPLYVVRGMAEMNLGRYEQSRSDLFQAMRLSPRDSQLGVWHTLLGGIELQLGHDADTIADERKAIEEGIHRIWFPYAYLAAAYAFAGKDGEAKNALAEARQINPALTVKWAMAHSADGPRFYEGLRKAGLPEE